MDSFKPEERFKWIRISVIFFLVAGMALSPKVWLAERYFPLVPVFDFLPVPSYPFSIGLLYLLGVTILLSFFYFEKKAFVFSILFFLAVLVAFDLNRLQPWIFQYLLMLSALIIPLKGGLENEKRIRILQIIISGIYIWSGIHKLNNNYFTAVLPWFKSPFETVLPSFTIPVVSILFYLFPLLEAASGIGLWFNKFRKASIIFIIFFHLLILFIIGPFGYSYNSTIWPWSIAMIIFTFLIFPVNQAATINFKDIIKDKTVRIFILICWILPSFNAFRIWPSYLSSNLYSGNTANGKIYVSEPISQALPEKLKSEYLKNEDQPQIINVKIWAMNELNINPWPEKRTFMKAKEYFMNSVQNKNEVTLMYTPKKSLLRSSEPEIY